MGVSYKLGLTAKDLLKICEIFRVARGYLVVEQVKNVAQWVPNFGDTFCLPVFALVAHLSDIEVPIDGRVF